MYKNIRPLCLSRLYYFSSIYRNTRFFFSKLFLLLFYKTKENFLECLFCLFVYFSLSFNEENKHNIKVSFFFPLFFQFFFSFFFLLIFIIMQNKSVIVYYMYTYTLILYCKILFLFFSSIINF